MNFSDHLPVSGLFHIKVIHSQSEALLFAWFTVSLSQVKGGSVPQVSFDPISPWSSDSSAKIVYHLPANFEPTPYHWIAFFLVNKSHEQNICTNIYKQPHNIISSTLQEGFTSLNDYVTWQWVPGKHLTDRPGTYETEVSRGALRNPAKYVVAYMSEKSPYSILGISSTFEVTDLAWTLTQFESTKENDNNTFRYSTELGRRNQSGTKWTVKLFHNFYWLYGIFNTDIYTVTYSCLFSTSGDRSQWNC